MSNTAPRIDYAREVRAHLTDPERLCRALDLAAGMKRNGNGVQIRCPAHKDHDPSCGVTLGDDGTIRVHCFGCQWTADGLGLIAKVRGYETRGEQFKDLLVETCRLLGLYQLESEISGESTNDGEKRERPRQPPPADPIPRIESTYAPHAEIARVWSNAVRACDDAEASAYLVRRKIDPDLVTKHDLLRAVPRDGALPQWARYHGASWIETGHRLIARLWDARGRFVSVRGWRITDSDAPKRLPPAGHKCSNHVLANRVGVGMLMGRVKPTCVRVVEGEPDHTVASIGWSEDAVLGMGSGWWSDEIARRIPRNARVIIATHHDEAGERYADAIAKSIGTYAQVWRSAPQKG